MAPISDDDLTWPRLTREGVRRRMAAEGIPVGTDDPFLLALGAKPLADIDLRPTQETFVPSAGDILADIMRARDAARREDIDAPGRPMDVLASRAALDHFRRELPPTPGMVDHGPVTALFGLPVYVDPRVPEGMAIIRGGDGRLTVLDMREAIWPEPSPAAAAEGTTERMDPQLRTSAIVMVTLLALVAAAGAALMVVAYWQARDELILPAAGLSVGALLVIKLALWMARER